MPVIRIDDEVFAELQRGAKPFVDTPNMVLRRLLQIDVGERSSGADAAMPIDRGSAPEAGSNGEPILSSGGVPPTEGVQNGFRRATAGDLLPQEAYFDPIIQSVYELGGSASSRRVIDHVLPKIRTRLLQRDFEPTRRGDVRWRNRAQWARMTLVERGYLVSDSPRGIWELSESGLERARELSSLGPE